MIKFTVNTTSFEDAVIDIGLESSRCTAVVDSLEEARVILSEFTPKTLLQSWNGRHFYYIEAAFIEKADYCYDENLDSWEFVNGSDICDIACKDLPIT